MPMYDYKCTKCSHEDELLIPMDDRELIQECTKCNNKSMERQLAFSTSINTSNDAFYRNNFGKWKKSVSQLEYTNRLLE